MNLKPKMISIAVWAKTYSHVLRIVGGFFFFLSVVTGIIWLCGFDVEPIAFMFGLLASVFFSAPSIAEYFVPNRKPIYQMSALEIIDFIMTTDAKDDWKRVSTNWVTEYYLIDDPRLRFRCRFDEAGTLNKDFKEPWANKHPDPSASSYWHDLYYDSGLIDRFVLVSVDGGRADIPLPRIRIGNETYFSGISELQYQIGKIHDYHGTFDEYMERCGLQISDPEN